MVDIGYRSGMLEVIKLSSLSQRGRSWLCKCDCGNEIVLQESHLEKRPSRNPNKSCGCHSHKQDGLTTGNTSRIYNIWLHMNNRCHKKTHDRYEYYGKKGIKVCDEWRNSFESFCVWSLDHGYSDNLTIDRIDSDGDYSPMNCRWVDMFVQAQNRGMNRNNTTGHRCISPHKNGYRVSFMRNGSKYHIGIFKTIDEAIVARDAALKQIAV